MDPQLLAARKAAREKFAAHQAKQAVQASTSQACGPPTTEVGQGSMQQAAAQPPASTSASALRAAVQASAVESLPPELLNLPISALLEDGPVEPPPAPKRLRRDDPGAVRVPKERTEEIRRALSEPAPEELRVLSWNIDGLDEVGGPEALMLRTLAVALEVARRRPLAAFLQEVVPPALELLCAEQVLGNFYDLIVPKNPPLPYYVAMLIDKRRAKLLGPPATVPFTGSQMGRQLLAVTVALTSGRDGVAPLLLATAHLESMKDQAVERKRQLLQSLRYLRARVGKAPSGTSSSTALVGAAVLAGDLNARDDEVRDVMRQLGTDSEGMVDAWTYCGSPASARYTWDTVENNNIAANFSCRTRFDRMFFFSPGVSDVAPIVKAKAKGKAKAKAAATSTTEATLSKAIGWRPTSFSLIGKARVPGLGRFPSDHWGILTSWSVGGGSAASALPGDSTAAAKSGPAEVPALLAFAKPTTGVVLPEVTARQAAEPREFVGLFARSGQVTIDLDDD